MSAVLFDTSVLVPHCVIAHPHRMQALAVIAESKRSGNNCCISLHSLAETFAVLSALPINPRISAEKALFLIEMEILQYFIIVPLSVDAYRQGYLVEFNLHRVVTPVPVHSVRASHLQYTDEGCYHSVHAAGKPFHLP